MRMIYMLTCLASGKVPVLLCPPVGYLGYSTKHFTIKFHFLFICQMPTEAAQCTGQQLFSEANIQK